MGREDDRAALGYVQLRVDEDGAAVGQLADHVPVVDDLLAHVDRGAEVLERPLDRVDGPVDTGAVAAWRCQHELSGNHAAYGNGAAVTAGNPWGQALDGAWPRWFGLV